MDALRPLLTTYAYNILGSVEDARDVVQDAFLKFMKIDADRIQDVKAYLIRSVINLAINAKKRHHKIVAAYPGEWLPEPVDTEQADTAINRKEVLSYSLMVLLEKLNPKQRAVFILREAFDYDHEEIASALDITVEYSRKLLSRGKNILKEDTPPDGSIPADYLNRYIAVIQSGDTARLEKMLNTDIRFISDGGGKASAAINPVFGKHGVSAMLLGLQRKFYRDQHLRLEQTTINHQPAILYFQQGELINCQVFTLKNGYIADTFFIRNPDKLKSLKKIS